MVMVVIMVMMMVVIEQSTPLTSYSYSSIIHHQQHREGEHQGHHHCLLVRRHPFHLEHLLLQEGERAQSCICVSLLPLSSDLLCAGAASVAGILSQWEHGDGWQVPQESDHTQAEREVRTLPKGPRL